MQARKGLTVLVRSKDGFPHRIRYSPEQIKRMRLAHEAWTKRRLLDDVASALGVSRERARQVLDRGAELGLYRDRRKRHGPSASTIHPQVKEKPSMPNLGQLLNAEILRLAKRAARPLIEPLRKELRHQRRLVAGLRAEVEGFTRDRRRLMNDLNERLARQPAVSKAEMERAHLGPKLILAQRRRLGLSQAAFARLLGVSSVSLWHWEAGRLKPRAKGREALIAIRQLGKREARERLAALGPPKPHRSRKELTETAKQTLNGNGA